MDTRIKIWNTLHDGEIAAISEDSDTLTMFVSIPYLRRRLNPLGDSFVLTLTGLTRAECRDFGGRTSSLREELEIGTPEILRTESKSMPITIETTMGQVILEFQAIRFALDTGQEVEYETIEKACEERVRSIGQSGKRMRSSGVAEHRHNHALQRTGRAERSF